MSKEKTYTKRNGKYYVVKVIPVGSKENLRTGKRIKLVEITEEEYPSNSEEREKAIARRKAHANLKEKKQRKKKSSTFISLF